MDGMPGVGRHRAVGFLLPPGKHVEVERMNEDEMDPQTLRSTPALPRASLRVARSEVSS